VNYIVDRRLNAKKKSTVNRQRFLRRYRQHIQKAVTEAVNKRSIIDMEKGEKISIPSKDISEPVFHHGTGGHKERVLPGNDQFTSGDHIPRPEGGGGQGSGSKGTNNSKEEMDEFVFQITQDEFLNFMFEDLALPNLIKRQLTGVDEFELKRAGISNEGSPGKINIIRSLRSANLRRIALTGKKRKELKQIEEELDALSVEPLAEENEKTIALLKERAAALQAKIKRTPWLDNFDLKYNLHIKHPLPLSRAVIFCIMDVSGSMDQETKIIAKRFFFLLYLFLQRNYERTEIVFIRHHTSAKEVDENEFFYARETGGTIVSSALYLMQDIIKKRYPPSQWNIYGAQASDGDNWNDDSSTCQTLLASSILPVLQYYAYIEITSRGPQDLWNAYQKLASAYPKKFSMRQLSDVANIFPVFRELFQKQIA
jgi:uncharacterized protein